MDRLGVAKNYTVDMQSRDLDSKLVGRGQMVMELLRGGIITHKGLRGDSARTDLKQCLCVPLHTAVETVL